MLALLVGLFSSVAGAASPAALPPATCPTGPQLVAELERMGEGLTVARLGLSEVTVANGTMRIVLRGPAGTTLGVREVPAPIECDKRISVAAVLLAAWANAWDETALAAATRAPAPSARPPREAELGLAVGGSADGADHAMRGGLLAGVQLREPLGLAADAEATGERQVAVGAGAATYWIFRLGAGPTVRVQRRVFWTDAALLAQVTRLSLEGKNLTTRRSAAVWGASAQLRARVGARWGQLAPFVGLTLNRAIVRERLTLDDTTDSTLLSPWDIGLEIGLSFLFGSRG